MSRILVVGLGNPLMGDDGAGPAAIRALRRRGVPPGVRLENGGSDGTRIRLLWRGEGAVWLVDALAAGRPPGTVHRLDDRQLARLPQRHGAAHHLSLPESLRWMRLAHPEMGSVRFRLWGVEPAALRPGEGLSPPVRRAVAAVAAEVARAAASTAAPRASAAARP